MEIATIIILAVLLVAREWQNWRDRRDLLDRIMCVDYREFKRGERKGPPPQIVSMTDEEMAKAEKKERG